jgi:hypothetical protein
MPIGAFTVPSGRASFGAIDRLDYDLGEGTRSLPRIFTGYPGEHSEGVVWPVVPAQCALLAWRLLRFLCLGSMYELSPIHK